MTDRKPASPDVKIVRGTDLKSAGQLLPVVYDELRRLARKRLRSGGAVTLDATALVHEAYARLVVDDGASFRGRDHFFAAAALAMRHVLVDCARRRSRLRHGEGRRPVTLSGHDLTARDIDLLELVALDDALKKLEKLAERKAKVVELRFFGGLSNAEIARALDISDATVERDWQFARAWLSRELAGDPNGG
ncbi:MAG: sigma-70 family RNA polymerase sigma factor [Planctomycetes bacterium]|nr:sigma-70 family RNA polymerase sigma factor [Planctomycetota bacterium]